jgi:hypothetical protein
VIFISSMLFGLREPDLLETSRLSLETTRSPTARLSESIVGCTLRSGFCDGLAASFVIFFWMVSFWAHGFSFAIR